MNDEEDDTIRLDLDAGRYFGRIPARVLTGSNGNGLIVILGNGGAQFTLYLTSGASRQLAEAIIAKADEAAAYAEHVDENHERRAEDGKGGPVLGCAACEEKFPSYFAEMREAEGEFAYRPFHDEVDHERGHEERPLIGITERAET